MATTKSKVKRIDDPSGDDFLTYDISTGEKAQGVVIVDANGAHAGIVGTPIVVSGTVIVDDSTPIDVAVTGLVTVDDSTPIDVAVTGTVTVDDSTPIDVAVTGTVTVDDSTPIAVAPSIPVGVDYSSGGTAVDAAVISATPAVLRELRCIMDPATTSSRYLMLFDAAALPITPGTAPLWRMLVPAGGEASESFNPGFDFPTNGIVAALSSTATTLTVTTATECFIHAMTE